MFRKFFSKEKKAVRGRGATVVTLTFPYSLRDTLECGQSFRHELICEEENYCEYIIPVKDSLITVGQQRLGELIFYTECDTLFEEVIVPYFTLCRDYGEIKEDILGRSRSEWLTEAAECGEGIAILRADPWQTLLSFIISQNNNIPRIRKIIRTLAAEYGENLAVKEGHKSCPAGRISGTPCEEFCRGCGICCTFPTPEDILSRPEGLLPSHPGFRYSYMLDAAQKVASGEVDLEEIASAASYEYTLTSLKRIKGVGDKVASCCALFGFGNLEAFPIDVWMKRAIDTYFDGKLDPTTLGKYAGVAQQYIFHYIRNIEQKS